MKNGFRVPDSDLHTMEADDLWEKYLDEPFRKFAPRFIRRDENAPNQPLIRIGDLWRLDEAWEKFGPGSEVQISKLPSEYFFRQCFIATDADEKPLRQVVEAIGDDSIVVSTDYPHSDGLFPVAIEEFTHLEGVSDETKAKILWSNCARLYRLAVTM